MSSIPDNFIFRYSIPAKKVAAIPTDLVPETLDETYSIAIGERYRAELAPANTRFSGQRTNSKVSSQSKTSGTEKEQKVEFDFRIGWHESGLIITVVLSGKRQMLRCDANSLEYSDGLRLCLDTRDVRDVHRGTRFCHRFFFMPLVSGARVQEPMGFWLPIHRAKSLPNPVDMSRFLLSGKVSDSGWALSTYMPATDLTGYDPLEHRKLGLHYTVSDMELGLFSLHHPAIFPTEEDPSLWATLELQS